jgi:hypothetical protein
VLDRLPQADHSVIRAIAGITTDPPAPTAAAATASTSSTMTYEFQVDGAPAADMPGGIGPNPATIWPSIRHIV